jgi:hypothetical protein
MKSFLLRENTQPLCSHHSPSHKTNETWPDMDRYILPADRFTLRSAKFSAVRKFRWLKSA